MKIFALILGLILAVDVQAQRFVRTAKNFAELQALNPNDPTATNVFVNGYSTVNDGGQGTFSWVWASATVSDGGTVLPPTAGTWSGRWKRQYDGPLNPAWFGADPGGSVSSLLSISNALTAASGKILRFPSGVFRINGVLQPPPGTTIEGVGPNTVLFIDSQDYGFLINGRDRVTFRNLKFFGPSVQGIRATNGASNITIENCEFTGFTSIPTAGSDLTTPIYCYGVNGLTIQNCKFYGNGFQAAHEQAYFQRTQDIVLYGYCKNVQILRNDFRETMVTIPVATFDCQNLTVADNFIDQGNFGTNSVGGFGNTGYGILSYVSDASLFTNHVLATNINILNNTITNTAGSGIYVIGADTVNVQGNNLFHVALQQTNLSVLAAGINLSAVRNFSMINNRIAWSSNNGAAFSSGTTNGVIMGNTITDVNLSGIELSSGYFPQTDLNFVGNTVERCGLFGLYGLNGTNYNIRGNMFSKALVGVLLGPVSTPIFGVYSSTVSDNSIKDCLVGIQILGGTGHKVTGNNIYASTNSVLPGIDYRGTNGWILENNISGYTVTKFVDSGTGNTFVSMYNQGVGINVDPPLYPLHIVTTNTAGIPQDLVHLVTGGGVVGTGPAVTFWVKDTTGTPIELGILTAYDIDGGPGNVLGSMDVWTTASSTTTKNFTFRYDGQFNAKKGYTINDLAGSGLYLRGNGTYGVFAALNGSDITAGTVAPARLGSGVTDATTYLGGDGTWKTYTAGLGGTVTSVALASPVEFTVSGSPVTTSGTLTFTKATQTTNAIWAGPVSGAASVPVFRGMVAADIPNAIVVATTKLSATGTKDGTTFLRGDDTWAVPPGGGGSGTVTSVAQTVPVEFAIAGSPVTTAGTLAITKVTQSSNTFWAGPTSGAAAQPAFRAFIGDDVPNGLLVASTKLSATGTKDSTTFLRGDDTWATPSGGSGTFFADPTGTIGLSAVNGTSTNAMRSDGHPALSQSISPTWSALHAFLNASTNQVRIGWDPTQSTWIYGDSGGQLNILPTGGEVNVTGILDASAGFKYANAATSGNYLRGNGTAFISAQLSASDLATGTVPTARLGSGTANSTTFLSGDQTYKTAVTSVSMNGLNDLFTISGVPITTTGTINPIKISQPANLSYSSPDGAAGLPTFRRSTYLDLPYGTVFAVSTNIPHSNVTNVYPVFTVPAGRSWIMTGLDVMFTGGGGGPDTFEMTVGTDSQVANIVVTGIPFGHNTAPVGYYETATLPADATPRFVATATLVVKVFVMFASTADSQFTVFLRGYYL